MHGTETGSSIVEEVNLNVLIRLQFVFNRIVEIIFNQENPLQKFYAHYLTILIENPCHVFSTVTTSSHLNVFCLIALSYNVNKLFSNVHETGKKL